MFGWDIFKVQQNASSIQNNGIGCNHMEGTTDKED